MSDSRASTGDRRRDLSEATFRAWLDEERTTAIVSEDHGQFYAYCVEFGIAAAGSTEAEVAAKVKHLLTRYLVVCCSEGRSYADAKKSPPTRIRLRSLYLAVRRRSLGRVRPSLSRLGGLISVPTADRDIRGLVH